MSTPMDGWMDGRLTWQQSDLSLWVCDERHQAKSNSQCVCMNENADREELTHLDKRESSNSEHFNLLQLCPLGTHKVPETTGFSFP